MRRLKNNVSALSLTELMSCTAIGAVVAMVAWVTVEMGRREVIVSRARTESSRNVFGSLSRMEHEVMRASMVQIPDPDYENADSIQLMVPFYGSTVRRAFRLEDGDLIVDVKDELAEPYVAFSGISSLDFSFLDGPTNSLVEIACMGNVDGQQIDMRTVAKKRN